MSKMELLTQEVAEIPESLAAEVLDFLRFLKTKAAAETMALSAASESSLGKDWLRPEEEKAWRNL